MPWIRDSRNWIPVFVSGTWILDSNLYWDSGFLELYTGFRSPGFKIPQAIFFPDSVFHAKNFPGFWNPDFLTWGDFNITTAVFDSDVCCLS